MLKLIAGKTISDTTDPLNSYEYTVPDMVKLANASVTRGDEVHIPVNVKNNSINFWESGGRNPKVMMSTATIVATESDTIPEAILFNKLNKNPNGKHALVILKPGYKLYVGKVHMKNSLAPKVKIIRLTFKGVSLEPDTTSDVKNITTYGLFVVEQVLTGYQDIADNIPATRLLAKLFATKVMRPYFVNGWSVSNMSTIPDREQIKQEFLRIVENQVENTHFTVAEDFMDTVETAIIKLNNPKLSSALQVIDFNTNLVTLRPLENIELSDIHNTIGKSTAIGEFSIYLSDLIGGYNPNILFGNTDLSMLEVALSQDLHNDQEFVTELGSRVFGILRGFKG